MQSIVTGKLALKYAGAQIEAIQNIAKASQHRSVAEFEKVSQPGSLLGDWITSKMYFYFRLLLSSMSMCKVTPLSR